MTKQTTIVVIGSLRVNTIRKMVADNILFFFVYLYFSEKIKLAIALADYTQIISGFISKIKKKSSVADNGPTDTRPQNLSCIYFFSSYFCILVQQKHC